MPSDLPKHLLKISIALLKSPVKTWMGEEFYDSVGDALLAVGGEEAQQKIDDFLLSIEGSKELLEVAQRADAHFQENCQDATLRGAFSLKFGNLYEVQSAMRALPKALDANTLEKELVDALERDLGDKLTVEQREKGAKLYRQSLYKALMPLKKYTQTIIAQTVLENGEKLDALSGMTQKGFKELKAILRAETPLPTQARKETLPGQLPHGSYLPLQRNQIFTGRVAYLAKLEKAFFDEKTSEVLKTSEVSLLTQTLSGMGGIGKTQLAVQFAYLFGYKFKGVHWIAAAGARTFNDILPAIATCGSAMSLAGFSEQNIAGQAEMTLGAWQAQGPRLIIVDNLEDADAANQILPQLRGGENHLLATSRYRDWLKTMPIHAIPLDEFSAAEALAFLREYLDEGRASDAEIETLAAKLGHLPLALELAGRYLTRKKISVGSYTEKLSLKHPSLSNWRAGKNMPSPTAHEAHIANSFAFSWEAIEETGAQNLYKLAGYFAPNLPLPQQSLYEAGEFESEDDFEEALLSLKAYALLKEDMSLHPLLAEFARSLDAEDELLSIWAKNFAKQCEGENGIRHTPLLYQHAQHSLPNLLRAVKLEENQEDGWFFVYLAWLLHYLGRSEEGIKFYKRAVIIFEEIGDKAGEGTALSNIANACHTQGDYISSLSYMKKSLKIFQEISDKEGEGRMLSNISQICHAQGDYVAALDYLRKSLTIQKEIGDKAGEGTTLGNLASTYYSQGDYASSLSYMKNSLEIFRKIGDKAKEGLTLNNISQVCSVQGDHTTALDYLKKSLAIQKKIGNKAGEGLTLNNISRIYSAQGDYTTALDYLKKSLAIRQEIGDKAGLCSTLFNIGHIHKQNDEMDAAMGKWIRVYKIAKEINEYQALQALANLAPQLGMQEGLAGWEELAQT